MAESQATFSESWYRLAGQRVYLRPEVKVRRQMFRGQRWMVLENPFGNEYFRVRPEAYELLARLTPERTVEEAWQQCLEKFPSTAPGQEAVLRLLSQLYYANLLHYENAADAAVLFERYEKKRKQETKGRLLNIMFMRFRLLDPDRLLNTLQPFLRFAISPVGLCLWLGVVAYGLKNVVDHWAGLKEQSQGVLTPANLPLLYVGMVLIKAFHEFGHAAMCKRFGGEVHAMGVMLMVFTPIPYMDATASWGFRWRWQRLLVGCAGMIFELFFAAIAAVIWANTGPGVLHNLCYNFMFVASVSTVIFNVNPLLRYDGYYILTDLAELPNLYQRGMEQLRYLVERYLFGVRQAESPATGKREVSWYTGYGITSSIYRVIVFGGILLFVADRFLLLGILMAAICGIAWVMVPLFKLANYLATSPRIARTRARAIGVTTGLAAGLVVLLQFIPLPSHFRAPGVLLAHDWCTLYAPASGRVEELLAPPGANIVSGTPLMRLANRELELELTAALASREEVEARLRYALQNSAENLKPLRSKLETAQMRIQRARDELDRLIVRARQDGCWILPQAKELLGSHVPKGFPLGVLVAPVNFEFVATVRQEEVDRLFSRSHPTAEVRLYGQAERNIRISELRIISAEQVQLPSAALGWQAGGEVSTSQQDSQGRQATEPFFTVYGQIESVPEGMQLLHGQTGKARFDLPWEPLLPRWTREFRQLLQRRYQL